MNDPELPSHFDQFLTVIHFEFIKLKERKRLLIGIGLAIVAAFLTCFIVPWITSYLIKRNFFGIAQNVRYFQFINIGVLAQLMTIFPIIYSVDTFSYEYQKQTGLTVFVQPIRREVLAAGKIVAGFVILAITLFVFYVIMGIAGIAAYWDFESLYSLLPLLHSYLVSLLIGSVYLGIVVFFNSLANRAIVPIAIMFFMIIFLSSTVHPGLFGEIYWFHYLNIPYISQIMLVNYFMDPILATMNASTKPHFYWAIGFLSSYVILTFFFTLIREHYKRL